MPSRCLPSLCTHSYNSQIIVSWRSYHPGAYHLCTHSCNSQIIVSWRSPHPDAYHLSVHILLTVRSLYLEDHAIQMLTISLYTFLRPDLELVHWASYHVEGGGGALPRFQVQLQLSVHELRVNTFAYTQVRWPSRPWEVTALRNDMATKCF
jgi:hypothetical protein